MTVAAIDAGTTGVRCIIFDLTGKVLGIGRESWDYTTPLDLEIAKEFDPEHFWHLICKVTKKAIKTSGVKPSEILAVATTSQRHGSVFLNKDGKEVYCGPNIDARGAMTQYIMRNITRLQVVGLLSCSLLHVSHGLKRRNLKSLNRLLMYCLSMIG